MTEVLNMSFTEKKEALTPYYCLCGLTKNKTRAEYISEFLTENIDKLDSCSIAYNHIGKINLKCITNDAAKKRLAGVIIGIMSQLESPELFNRFLLEIITIEQNKNEDGQK